MFLPILCRVSSLLKGYSAHTLARMSGNISGTYIMAKESDAERMLSHKWPKLTVCQSSILSEAVSSKLHEAKKLVFTPFFKGTFSAKCQSFNISDKNTVQRNCVQLKSF